MTSLLHPQLPLALAVNRSYLFDNYIAYGNEQLLAELQGMAISDGPQKCYLWGAAGVGISHLLQACCQSVPSGKQAMYLPLDQLMELGEQVLDGMESLDLVVIDHLEQLAGLAKWEEALFHLYNRIDQAQGQLLIGAKQPPSLLDIGLADLKSRLNACLIYQVKPLTDTGLETFIAQQASHFGLEIKPEVTQYILHHGVRTVHDLRRLMQDLDQQSLSANRRLTIPFVKSVMNGL